MLDATALTDRYIEAALADRELRLAVQRAPFAPVFAEVYRPGLLSRPLFAEEAKVRAFADDLTTVFRLLVSLPKRLFDGDLRLYCAAAGINQRLAALMTRGVTGDPPLFGRSDAYHDGTNFRLLEFNVGTELGGMDFAEMNRGLLQVEAFRRFADENDLGYVDTVQVVAAVLHELAAPITLADRPVVTLMETTGGVAAHPMYRSVQEAFVHQGIDFRLSEVQDARLEGGKLFVGGTPIDVVLRFYAAGEILECPYGVEVLEPIYAAHESGKTLLYTGLENSLFNTKGGLAILSDDRFRSAFSARERDVIDRVIPWTRLLTSEAGADLIEVCRANRSLLILKPSVGWGGAGAVVGAEVADDKWNEVLQARVDGGYVVQELVCPVTELVCDPEVARVEPWQANWGVFVTPRGYAGTFLRALKPDDGRVITFSNSGTRATSLFTTSDRGRPGSRG